MFSCRNTDVCILRSNSQLLRAVKPTIAEEYCIESFKLPVLVATLSKALVCGCSLAGIAGSNAAGGMDARLL